MADFVQTANVRRSVRNLTTPTGVSCGSEPLDADGAKCTATPCCETEITKSLLISDVLLYRSTGSTGQGDLEIPETFAFTAIGSGLGTGLMSFNSKSLEGIDTTSELGYTNLIGENIMAGGRFTIGEDVQWSSFSKTFDVQELT